MLLLAGLAVVGTAPTADAAFVAAICDDAACNGAGDVIVNDEGAGDTALGVAGLIGVTGLNVAGWEITISTNTTKPLSGTAASPFINLTYSLFNPVGGTAAPIWLYAGDTDFTGTGSVHLAVNSSTADQDTVGLALGGDNNLVGANGLNLTPLLATVSASGVFSTTITGGPVPTAVAPGSPYALTAGVAITDTGGIGTSTGDVTVTVPEPAMTALFGLGLFGAAVASRRRRKDQAPV